MVVELSTSSQCRFVGALDGGGDAAPVPKVNKVAASSYLNHSPLAETPSTSYESILSAALCLSTIRSIEWNGSGTSYEE